MNAEIYGISWLGNGATIKHMPLLNIIAFCGDSSPMVVSILDCTNYMSNGGKKFIMLHLKEKVKEVHGLGLFTDCFFFDGASNVQKAGAILCTEFKAMYFHGGKQVLSYNRKLL